MTAESTNSLLPTSVVITDDTMREGLQIESASIPVEAKKAFYKVQQHPINGMGPMLNTRDRCLHRFSNVREVGRLI